MTNTIVVCGYGPGISDAVARKFGREGFQVALVARGGDKLDQAAQRLSAAGLTARGFACDLSDAAAVKQLFAKVRETLGPVTVLHWNAYAPVARDLTQCDVSELERVLDVGVIGLTAAIQACLTDLRVAAGGGAVLVTGGGLALYEPDIDEMAASSGAMGLSIAKAAQHKLVGVFHAKLKPENIYVGEVLVNGSVRSHASDRGDAALEPAVIAERFWEIYRKRGLAYARVP